MRKPRTPPASHTERVEQEHLEVRFPATKTQSVPITIIITAQAHEAGRKALEAAMQKWPKELGALDDLEAFYHLKAPGAETRREKSAGTLKECTQEFKRIKSLEELQDRVRGLIVHSFLPRRDPRADFLSGCVKCYYDAVCRNLGVEHPLNQQPSVHR